jgi:DNA polymerase
MSNSDPRLAAIAQSLSARLELEFSMGTSHVQSPSLPEEEADRLRELVNVSRAKSAGQTVAAPRPVPQEQPALTRDFLPPLPEEKPVGKTALSLKKSNTTFTPEEAGTYDSGSAERQAALLPIRAEAFSCRRCGLWETRNHVVFGEGSVEAELMFVGEAPGREEDEQGRPFVGAAGRLLTDMIEKGMRLPRQSVYIGNILKCRPPGNRDPELPEIVSCFPYLKQQVSIIKPKVIVALGRYAGNALTGQNLSMGQLRGTWWEFENIPLRAIYHPSYLLRERRRAGKGVKTPADRKTWEDLQEILRKLSGD